jgi:alkanesulfonate monooxygenase SsuD/methylene tetrahydromethanopterin reductase-like flavin-dependent oxidoreductase (luciferase family)
VGATFEKMVRMAGGVADGMMMSDAPLGRLPDIQRWLGDGLARAGCERRDFRVNNFMAWHVKEDKAKAEAEARQELVWRGFLLPWFTETFLDGKTTALVAERKPAFLQAFLTKSSVIEGVPEAVVDKLVENLTLTGDASDIDRIARHLHTLEAAGLDEVALRLHADPEDGLRMIGEHLMPALSLHR